MLQVACLLLLLLFSADLIEGQNDENEPEPPHTMTQEEWAREKQNEGIIKHTIKIKIFDFINRIRAVHGTAPLKLGGVEMHEFTTALALNMAITGRYGYNMTEQGYEPISYVARLRGGISYLTDDPYNPNSHVVRRWYRTKRYYNGSYNEIQHRVYAPFTTMVWRSSQKVAISIERHTNNYTAVVAHFDPPGNLKDADYDWEVLQPNILPRLL